MATRAGLGLLVGAVVQWPAMAQTPPVTPRDTLRPAVPVAGDTVTPGDSLTDSLAAPFARSESPGIEEVFWWSRDAIFQSGVQTLAELLEVVPGVTSFRSGFLASPAVVAYMGDVGRLRVFYDGIELAPLDPRTGGVFDLLEIPLWTAEEVGVERAAGELRVHVRSWRARSTAPVSRVDVYTGDENANLYRGFFGRRFRNGLGLQVGAQQYSTTSRGTAGGGDELSLLARLGWARGSWSADAFVVRGSRAREAQAVTGTATVGIPALEGRRTDAYLRAAYGDPDGGPWAQLIAGSMAFEETTPNSGAPPPTDPDEPVPSPDTVRSRAQYVATGGMTVRGFRISAANRVHVFDSRTFVGQSGRIALDTRRIGISLFGERAPQDSTLRADIIGRMQLPGPFWVGGSVSQRWDDDERVDAQDLLAFRAEAGVRLGRIDLSGGVLGRDSTALAPARVFNATAEARADGAVLGPFAAINGALWRDVNIQAHGVMWDEPGPYRPRYQSRVQLYLATRWLSRFPSGNFGFLASGIHDYKSSVCFPIAGGTCATTNSAGVISTLVEIRLLNAVLSWKFTNTQLAIYERVPGFRMPRGSQFYGVRWEFTN
jgi:hypothetical protein